MIFRKLSNQEIVDFRQWANENYTPGSEISQAWHPVIQIRCAEINLEKLTEG